MNQIAFGSALKQWRSLRGMSQMALGSLANVSARHVSFLETGRANPSRGMVQLLSRALDLPRSAQNHLLNASGFSGTFGERQLDENGMGHILNAIEWTLDRHAPYPAFAINRHWQVIKANQAARNMMVMMEIEVGQSLLEVLCDEQLLQRFVKNWREAVPYIIARLRTESAYHGGDDYLDGAVDKLALILGQENNIATGILPAVIPITYLTGGLEMSFISTIAQFGTAEDIALADMMIELMFPADETTKRILEQMAGS